MKGSAQPVFYRVGRFRFVPIPLEEGWSNFTTAECLFDVTVVYAALYTVSNIFVGRLEQTPKGGTGAGS